MNRLSSSVVSLCSSSLVLVPFVVGCSKPPAPPPPPPAAVEVAPPPLAKIEPPDLSPVAAPATLFVRASWKNPAASLKTLEGIIGRPLDPFVQEAIGDAEVAELLAFDAPAHAVLLADPLAKPSGNHDLPDGMSGVFSLPLKDYARARSYAERHANVEPVRNGVVRVRRGSGERPMCSLAVSAGAAPARLVCGDTDAIVDSVLPWLTRTAAIDTTQQSDLEIVASGPVLWNALQPHLGEITRELSGRRHNPANQRWADETFALVQDTKQVDMRITLDKKDIRWSYGFEIAGKKSSFTQLLLSGKPTGMPAELARVPADATFLGFSSGLDAALARKLFGELLHTIADESRKDPVRNTIEKETWIATRAPFFAPFAFVRGEAVPEPIKSSEYSANRRLREERAAVGWEIAIVEEAPTDFIKYVVDSVAVMEKLQKSERKNAPPLPFKVGAAPAGFPTGSKAVVFTSKHYDYSPQGKNLPDKKQLITLVLSPHGKKTIMALGVDTKALALRVKEMTSGTGPVPGTEERNAQLADDFKGASMGFAVLPANISKTASAVLATSSPLRGTPNGGVTPVPFVVRLEKDGTRLVAEMHMHEKSVTDAGAMARFGLDMLAMVMRKSPSRSDGMFVPLRRGRTRPRGLLRKPSAPAGRRDRIAVQAGPDGDGELERRDGLLEEDDLGPLRPVLRALGIEVARHADDLHRGRRGAETSRELDAGHAGHHEIGDDEVDRITGGLPELDRLERIGGFDHAVAAPPQRPRGHRADLRVVLDHEDGLVAGGRGASAGERGGDDAIAAWETNVERAALAQRRVHVDLSARALDDAEDGREPEARALGSAFRAEERLENARLDVVGDARPGVADRQDDPTAVLAPRDLRW